MQNGKLLGERESKFDISQADLCQLFAYGKKYKCKKLYLIYPQNDNFTEPLVFEYGEEMILRIYPLDLSSLANGYSL
jgi:5-methylcytosine-specific restriction enzyme subunit McrC